ncbi:Lysophospholipase L1 [Sinomicrobium oceani]|uniref:Lysophospholipase L1 n=1 Tax=Sinomicrobium oceani TaxID=1150368 RepID=A0A1K1ML42_9FLAO|nr:GDSL-type esterase/lipase family protein [Sinomicrobium oceani]SFW23872.1 Lysophospholipase L1 [Sinomicrobium oceani]
MYNLLNGKRQVFLLAIVSILSHIGVSGQQCSVINAGVPGNTTGDLLARLDTDVLEQHPDLVLMMIGTNDMLNTSKMISFEEYENNLKTLSAKIKEQKIRCILISPPPVDTVYLYQRHDPGVFDQDPNSKLYRMTSVLNKLKDRYGFGMIDLYHAFTRKQIPVHNRDSFIKNESNSGEKDGVHPTAKGYYFIAERIYEYLKENNLIQNNSKILCLGDSITYGLHVEGEGTSRGETYPAFLQQLIAN